VGYSWTSAIFLTGKRSPQEEITNIRPGTFQFWLNTKGTNGLYGETPQGAYVTIPVPKNWNLYATYTNDYSTGTFDNTQRVLYSGLGHLRCTHVDGLVGTWESPDYDAGIIKNFYCYVETNSVVVGESMTWQGVIPDTDPTKDQWSDIGIETQTWNQIFSLNADAPEIEIQIMYKTEASLDWQVLENCELLSGIVEARYFKVKMIITDKSPNLSAYIEAMKLKLYV
jgi:hypothetical protein